MKIAIIGTGNMGGALARAFSASPETELFLYNRGREKAEALAAECGGTVCGGAAEAAAAAEYVLLAVKPYLIAASAAELQLPENAPQVVISVAAGTTIAAIEAALPAGARVVRTMPNTPAAVGEGMTAVSFADGIDDRTRGEVVKLFTLAGRAEVIPESLMNAVPGISGSSPAYVYMLIEALADGGVRSGLSRPAACTMAAQAVLGAAKMVLETGRHPGELKDAVCSPGGTTIEAVAALERSGFRGAVIAAMEACNEKAKNLL